MNKKIIFIMDYTFEEIKGGAELNTQTLSEAIKKEGCDVSVIKSAAATVEFLTQNS